MKALTIASTSNSPKVLFEPTTLRFEMSGESRPENVSVFYQPILDWIKELEESLTQKAAEAPVEFNFSLEYFNSTSAKYLLDFCKKIGKLYDAGHKMIVKWHFEEDDEDMLEVGKEISRMAKIPFEYVEVKE